MSRNIENLKIKLLWIAGGGCVKFFCTYLSEHGLLPNQRSASWGRRLCTVIFQIAVFCTVRFQITVFDAQTGSLWGEDRNLEDYGTKICVSLMHKLVVYGAKIAIWKITVQRFVRLCSINWEVCGLLYRNLPDCASGDSTTHVMLQNACEFGVFRDSDNTCQKLYTSAGGNSLTKILKI